MNLYFGERGIRYSVGRIHINSCDFSLKPYSFDEVEDDFKVSTRLRVYVFEKIYHTPTIIYSHS